MGFLDPALIAELSATVLGVTQAVKNQPRLKRIDGELIAVAAGTLTGVLWFLSRGEIVHDLAWHAVNWQEGFTALVNGLLGGIAASTGFNLQKVLPIPNLLPTRTEKEGEIQWPTSSENSGGQSEPSPPPTDGEPSPPLSQAPF